MLGVCQHLARVALLDDDAVVHEDQGVAADAVVIPHGPLREVGVDVVGMGADVPPAELADIDTKRAGWWTMTMKESQNGASVQPPKHVFDPAVTPPSQCMKA